MRLRGAGVHGEAGVSGRSWPWRRLALTAMLAGLSVLGIQPDLVRGEPDLQSRHTYLETFEGKPSAPQPVHPANWDVAVHSRNRDAWQRLEPMAAMHGADCSPPPAVHLMATYEDAVFQCNGHLMTAINASGYGVIYLTPGQMVDFSGGEAVIKFDMSTLRTSVRDWVDIWITPYEDQLQLPLQTGMPDLTGEPRRSVQIKMDQFNGDSIFRAYVYRETTKEDLKSNGGKGFEAFLQPSAVRRDPFELRISRTSIKFGMPTYNFWWIDTRVADLGWDRGIVQFGHHSYTPDKDCNPCGPNTWHWDNVGIDPAVPFTIVPAGPRLATEDGTTITFSQPAPEGGYLRFAGIGQRIDVSYDDGATWLVGQRKPVRVSYLDDKFSSYWMPVPAGLTSVKVRGEGYYGGGWAARDFSVWSLQPPTDDASAGTEGDAPGQD